MLKVGDTLKLISKSTVLVADEAIIVRCNIKPKGIVKLCFDDGATNSHSVKTIKFSELAPITTVMFGKSVVPAVMLRVDQVLDRAAEISDLRPAVLIIEWKDKPNVYDQRLRILFGEPILSVSQISIHSRLDAQALRELANDDSDPVDHLLALISARRRSPDVRMDGNRIVFGQEPCRRWFYGRVGLSDFIYRYNRQDYRVFRNNPTDADRLMQWIRDKVVTADPSVIKALMNLKTETATTLATAPIHQPSPLAKMAELLRIQSPSIVKISTGEIIPVTVIHRNKSELGEVLTFHEDGTVEFSTVERTHRKLFAYLSSSASTDGSKDTYSEDEITEFSQHFSLPDIPSVAEVSPERIKKADEAVNMIEDVIKDRTGRSLLKFQREDLVRLLAKGFGILGWDPGLGKTLAGLVFALGAVALGAKPRVLIVCPQDLVQQWFREIRKFFGQEFADQFIIVHNLEEAINLVRIAKLVPKHIPLYAITWYEVLRSATSVDKPIERKPGSICPECKQVIRLNKCSAGCPFDEATHLLKSRDAAWFLKKFVKGGVLVVDEATYIKSDTSKRGIAARRLVTAKYRLLLTGTPIKNLLSDLPMLLQLAAKPNSDAYPFPAESDGVAKFSKQFMVIERNLDTGRRRLGPEPTNIAVAQRLLSATILRRTKDQTGEEVVPLKIEVHKVPLTEAQAAWYKAWCDDTVFERWFYMTHDREIHPIAKILSRMSHLMFVIGHPTAKTATGAPIPLSAIAPKLPTPSELTHKNRLVVDLATEFYKDSGYAVIFAQTVGVLPVIAQELDKRGVPVHLAVERKRDKVQSLPPFKRGQIISTFERKGGVLLASISAMAYGHDLAFVPRAIIHSLCFAYDQYAQAIMRVHRIVSEKPVEVHVICGNKTLDEYLFDLLRRKDEAAKQVLDGTVIERSTEITHEEWQKLWRQVQESADEIEVE